MYRFFSWNPKTCCSFHWHIVEYLSHYTFDLIMALACNILKLQLFNYFWNSWSESLLHQKNFFCHHMTGMLDETIHCLEVCTAVFFSAPHYFPLGYSPALDEVFAICTCASGHVYDPTLWGSLNESLHFSVLWLPFCIVGMHLKYSLGQIFT